MSYCAVGAPLMVRVNINGSAGAETVLDLKTLSGPGGVTERINPWQRIDMRSFNTLDFRWAAQAGEIGAGRYFTAPQGQVNTIVGPGIFDTITFLGGTAVVDIIEVAVYR